MIIIPIFWTERTKIPNLEEMVENYHRHGGSIIQYDRLFSIILFTRRYPKFEWVPPHQTRRAAGKKHALWCFLFGWWSIGGILGTTAMIVNNLLGGIDVTRVLTTPPPLPGQPFDDAAWREYAAAQKRQQWIFVGSLFFLLILAIIFFVIPYL